MRVKRIGEVAMANTLSSHSIIRDCKHSVVPSFCYCKATLVSCSETATARFRFTGTNSARQPPTLFTFLILFSWSDGCAHVYARAGKSSLFKRFVASLPITSENIVRFLIKEMLFSKG